ncbi:MAG: hypothetical protein H8D67_31055 [Deltaproteobacteria bacterium]|nr:hypothetical protein [Deltaproteobacteria bacterium]MBL7110703.1 hypothetical protein [Bacteroidales bacterium]
MAIINNLLLIKTGIPDATLAKNFVSSDSYDRRIFRKNHYADAIALQPVIRKRPQALCGIGILEVG